ncbi:MAG: hypothetical protein V3U95_01900 [Dehalococcoidia bacterium]|nr:hypothetical protein [Chloroflexota bacterium]MCZ6867671.1 hypothetical protein [Chloroflexota bacterium]
MSGPALGLVVTALRTSNMSYVAPAREVGIVMGVPSLERWS